jgi:hypothetical protein
MSIRALFNAKAAMKERPDFHDASPQDVGDDDSYHSDGGDAVAQLGALTKRKSLNIDSTAHGKNWWGYVAPCNYNK